MTKIMPELNERLLIQIAEELRPTFSNTRKLSEESVVLVVGSSGAGVSTVFNYLNATCFTKEAGRPVPCGFPESEIRDGMTTQTTRVVVSHRHEHDARQPIFLDVPGFSPIFYQQNGKLNCEENQYGAKEIAVSLAQLIAARSSKTSKVVFVLDLESIINPRDGGFAFKNVLENFITYLPNFKTASNAILFVFNQGKSAKKNFDELTLWLNRFKDDHRNNANIMSLLDIIFSAIDKNNAVMLNLLTSDDRVIILEKLSTPSAIPANAFQLVAPMGMNVSLQAKINSSLSDAASVLRNAEQAAAQVVLFQEISSVITAALNDADTTREVTTQEPVNPDINLFLNVSGIFDNLDVESDRESAESHLNQFRRSQQQTGNYQRKIKDKKEQIQQLNEEIKKLSKEDLTVLASWHVNEPVKRGDDAALPLWVPFFPDMFYAQRHRGELTQPRIRFTNVSYEELSPAGKANGTFLNWTCKPDAGELVWWYIPSKEATEFNYRVTVYCTTYSYNEITIKQKKAEKATLEKEVTDLTAKKTESEKSMTSSKQIIQQFLTNLMQQAERRAEPCRREFDRLKNKLSDPIQTELFAFYLRLNSLAELRSEFQPTFLNAFARYAKFSNVNVGVDELRETAIRTLSIELPDNNAEATVTSQTYPALANLGVFAQGRSVSISASAAPEPIAAQTSLSS